MYPNQRRGFESFPRHAAKPAKSKSDKAVLSGLLLAIGLSAGGSAAGQMPGHGTHPPMPNQNFVLSYSVGVTRPNSKTVAIDLANSSMQATLEQTIELPLGWPALLVTRFLPQADLHQSVRAGQHGRGRPAIQLSITGPTQTIVRWLIADDMQRNRLASYIGTWRLMDVADRGQRKKLFEQFEGELTREPRLLVRYVGEENVEELPAVEGKTVRLQDFNASIRVIHFYPHFGIDQESKEPVNQSARRLNPAALVEIDLNDAKREEWIFSRFPEYRQHQDDPLPFWLTLDCPSVGGQSVPDYLIVMTNGKRCDLAARYEGKTSVRSLGVGDSVEVSGSQYRFSISSMHQLGHLTEVYEPSKAKGGVPALRVETRDDSGATEPVWLELGKSRIIPTSNGPLRLTFHLEERQGAKGHP